jgi:deoxyadenosine/deoxycytidine kinase
MTVWISGPTGAGKTTLTRAFAEVGYSVIEETLPVEVFRAFSYDPKGNCARLQESIMRSRFESFQKLVKKDRLVFDRSIDEDAQVFCRMHRDLGLLDHRQFETLRTLADELQGGLPAPDIIIFLSSDVRVLAERLARTGGPKIIADTIDRQIELYSRWIESRREEVITLDNSRCTLGTLGRLFPRGNFC